MDAGVAVAAFSLAGVADRGTVCPQLADDLVGVLTAAKAEAGG